MFFFNIAKESVYYQLLHVHFWGFEIKGKRSHFTILKSNSKSSLFHYVLNCFSFLYLFHDLVKLVALSKSVITISSSKEYFPIFQSLAATEASPIASFTLSCSFSKIPFCFLFNSVIIFSVANPVVAKPLSFNIFFDVIRQFFSQRQDFLPQTFEFSQIQYMRWYCCEGWFFRSLIPWISEYG